MASWTPKTHPAVLQRSTKDTDLVLRGAGNFAVKGIQIVDISKGTVIIPEKGDSAVMVHLVSKGNNNRKLVIYN